MKRKNLLPLLLVLPLFWTCSSSKYSYKKRNSSTIVAVVEKRNILHIDLQNPQELVTSSQRGMLAPFLGKSVNLATQMVKKAIDNEQKKYFAQSECGVTDLFFYENVSQIGAVDPTGMQFGGLRIIRTFESKNGVLDTAYIIELEVDTSDVQGILNNDFFHLKIKRADIRYAEAKVPGAKWYLPWTYFHHQLKDDKLNMDFEITFTTSFINEAGELKTDVEFGKFFLLLRDIPLNPKMEDYQQYRTNMIGQSLLGKCFLVPRSKGNYVENYGSVKSCFSKGNYNVKVNVTESGSEHFILKSLVNSSATQGNKVSAKQK